MEIMMVWVHLAFPSPLGSQPSAQLYLHSDFHHSASILLLPMANPETNSICPKDTPKPNPYPGPLTRL